MLLGFLIKCITIIQSFLSIPSTGEKTLAINLALWFSILLLVACFTLYTHLEPITYFPSCLRTTSQESFFMMESYYSTMAPTHTYWETTSSKEDGSKSINSYMHSIYSIYMYGDLLCLSKELGAPTCSWASHTNMSFLLDLFLSSIEGSMWVGPLTQPTLFSSICGYSTTSCWFDRGSSFGSRSSSFGRMLNSHSRELIMVFSLSNLTSLFIEVILSERIYTW